MWLRPVCELRLRSHIFDRALTQWTTSVSLAQGGSILSEVDDYLFLRTGLSNGCWDPLDWLPISRLLPLCSRLERSGFVLQPLSCPVRAAEFCRLCTGCLDIALFCCCKRDLDLNPEVSDRILDLSSSEAQDLAWVHDAFWIERPFYRAHDVELRLGGVVSHRVNLLDADAMFRRYRTSHRGDEIVHGPRDPGGILGQRPPVHA